MKRVVVLVGLMLCAAVSYGQVPRVLSYQGVLTDSDGRLLPDGEYRLTVRLYDRVDASDPLYVEEHRAAAVRGVVNLLIGSIQPLPAGLAFDRAYYVGVSINGGQELGPRTMLTAVPYALRSESSTVADVARSLAPEALKGVSVQTHPTGPAGGDLTGTYPYPLIGTGKVTTAKIASQAVTTDKIAQAAVTAPKLHNMGAQTGQYLRWNGTQWGPSYVSADAWALTGNAITSSQFLGTTNAQPLVIRTSNVERMRVDASGNVGIGTASPTNRLHVVATSDPLRLVGLQTDNTLGDVLVVDASGVVKRRDASTLVGGAGWLLGGNSGTTPWDGSTGNFLGTTDANKLVIATTDAATPQPIELWVGNQPTLILNAPGGAAPAWSIQRGGGAPRGMHAVDLQSSRSAATQVASGDYSVIAGGENNTASGGWSFVGGGYQNTASGYDSFVGGGVRNTASVGASVVGGGGWNTATGQYSFVGGGYQNTASGDSSVVGGGGWNTASGGASVVGGGEFNIASGSHSAIPGGYNLRVGDRSFGFSGQTSLTQTNLSAASNIAAFVDVDMWLYNVRNQASQLRLYEPSGSGTDFTAFQAQEQASDIVYTLPASLTTTTTVAAGILQTDGSGNLSWVDPSALGGGNAWSLVGNSGTTPWDGTEGNFLGTTDANKLVIATTDAGTPQPIELWVGNQPTLILNAPGTAAPAWSIQRDDGGDTRGLYAVDLQGSRYDPAMVASGDYSVIAGGQNNTASGYGSVVGGGVLNTASGTLSIVGGGELNTASGNRSVVGGGWQNTASGGYSFVGGGEGNTASGDSSFVGGGFFNTASRELSFVGCGAYNTASGYASVVGGGQANTTIGVVSFVGGGVWNTASGWSSFVGGGQANTASGWSSFVGGGDQNTASGWSSFVGGGYQNTASGDSSVVGGGGWNTASGNGSFVGGGQGNIASGWYSFVGGGYQDTASGNYSVVGGGRDNTASGQYSAIIGGLSNTANADFVLVFGYDVDPTVNESNRVYLFDGPNYGFLVVNREDGDYPIHVGTDGTNGDGAYLSTGGQWTNASSRTKKDRFVQLDRTQVLAKIRQLPVEGWFYKGTQEYHIGPYAEDFHDAFGTGVLDGPDARTSLAASDVAGVALVGVQALAERVDRLEQTSTISQTESRLQQLEQENAQLRQTSQQLQQRVEQLERLVEQLARGNSTAGGEQPMLGDAIPNPHDGTTTISCLVPRGVGQAVLRVSDVRGQVVRSELLPLRGVMVSVTVDMRDLPSGTYDYSLVLDGRVVATKQMQLVK